jgi:hypothetical protein
VQSLGYYEKPSLRWTTFADPDGDEFDLVTLRAVPGVEGE